MSRIKLGCRVETGVPEYETAASLAQHAENAGYDSVWIRDHVAIPETTGSPHCLEAFTMLAGLARDTKRVNIGTLVICTTWRNPALMAKMAATIDVMSGGRLILGLGAGAGPREFKRYGFTHMPTPDRVRMVAEAVQIMKKMWTEESPAFHGRYYNIDGAVCDPKPKSQPSIPIYIGAGGEQLSLKNVVRYADGWHWSGNIEDYRKKAEVVNRLCEELGRDPKSLKRSVHVSTLVGSKAETSQRMEQIMAQRESQNNLRDRTLIGTPEEMADFIHQYQQLGVDQFVSYFWDSEIDGQHAAIETFGAKVIPLVR